MFNRTVTRQTRSLLVAGRASGIPKRLYSDETARPLARKEKAHEDQYARHQEEIALKKLREHIQEAKKHLADLEKQADKKEKK